MALDISRQQEWHKSKRWQCMKSLLAVRCQFQSFPPRVVRFLLFRALRHGRGIAVGERGLRAGFGRILRRGVVPLQGSDWNSSGGRVSFPVLQICFALLRGESKLPVAVTRMQSPSTSNWFHTNIDYSALRPTGPAFYPHLCKWCVAWLAGAALTHHKLSKLLKFSMCRPVKCSTHDPGWFFFYCKKNNWTLNPIYLTDEEKWGGVVNLCEFTEWLLLSLKYDKKNV